MVDYTKLPDIIVLDSELNETTRISPEVYEYFKWVRNYRTPDTFEFRINKSRYKAQYVLNDNTLALAYYDGTVYRAGFIEQVQCTLSETGIGDETVVVTGRSGGMFAERICLRNTSTGTGYDTQTGNAESVMRHYVDVNCINAVNGSNVSAPNRVVPNLQLSTNHNYGNTVTVSARFDVLSDLLENISLSGNVGWDIEYDRANKHFVFCVLQGTDHSSSGTFPVIFKPELNNVKGLDYTWTQLGSKSLCYVAGQGEAQNRVVSIVYNGTEPSGYNRRETFIDQRQTDNSSELITAGNTELESNKAGVSLSAEISPIAPLQYQVDYNIGDIVTVSYTDIAVMDARIISVTDEIIGGSRGDIRLITLSLGTESPDIRRMVRYSRRKTKEQLL